METLKPTKIEILDPADLERPVQKKVKLKKKPKTWAKAALPGGEIPRSNPSLGILTKDVKLIPLSEKADTSIVPTTLCGLNRALKVGGVPTGRMGLFHGPSKGGKTALCLGLVRSFQLQSHLAVYIDAEHTLDKKFVSQCGVDLDQMQYLAPMTYEETTEKVEALINNFRVGREKGNIPLGCCLLIVVDSITKLVPKNELKELGEVGKQYPLRAYMNAVWLDKLTPIVGSLPILFVMLAHEKTKIDATVFEKKYNVKGGGSLIYDTSFVVRVKEVGVKKRTVAGKKVVVGKIHEGVVDKSKIGVQSEKFRFVMGQGREGYPIGFDYCEEVIEEAKLRGSDSPIVRQSGGVWKHDLIPDGSMKGDAKFVDWLRENPKVVDAMVTELNETAIDVVIEEEEEDEE
jgi:RecA/RadA recombinase